MDINPSEVTKILKEQIKKFGDKSEVTEIGQVLSVGDGIARIYGLDSVQAGEICLLYTSPSPRDATLSRMPSSA